MYVSPSSFPLSVIITLNIITTGHGVVQSFYIINSAHIQKWRLPEPVAINIGTVIQGWGVALLCILPMADVLAWVGAVPYQHQPPPNKSPCLNVNFCGSA